MERKKLVAARVRRHWTLAQAAERLLVDINTLSRWERGKATPRAYNLQQLCDVYEVAASELDIEDDHSIDMQSILVKDIPGDAIDDTLKALAEQDLTLHLMKVNASTSLQQAHDAFFTDAKKEESTLYAYMDHDLSNFLLDDGVTRLFMVQYEEALESFAKIINPNDLSSRIPVAERIRIEILNYQTVALLKSSNKDMKQTMYIWQNAIQGARALKSEQRFSEACTIFEMMECVWPREKTIDNLRELTLHW